MAVAQDLRLPIYTSVACRCLDTDHIISLMNRVQWDIKEVMSQHSHYVDVILQVNPPFLFLSYSIHPARLYSAKCLHLLHIAT